MRRPLHPDEHRLWAQVTATVHPMPGRASQAPPHRMRRLRSSPRRARLRLPPPVRRGRDLTPSLQVPRPWIPCAGAASPGSATP